ncbi:MAG TPA: hypothetical protein VNZ44_16455 [Pyrinomonadaceae bacterium]|nr:hypothetical protein [Pyrinomonadaceae bacterium]
MKYAIDFMRLTTAAAFLLMALVPCARAQGSDDEGERRSECRRAAGLERRRCENEISAPGSPAPAPDGLGRPARLDEASLPLTRINEDLDYLQNAVNYLSHAASRDDALDPKSVGKTASEVARRAGRLRDSLALPRPREGARRREEDVIGDAERLRAALLELSELTADAVRNPVLRGHLLDPAMSAEAWRDLDGIVELSDRIRTGSDKLVKTRR